MLNERQLAFLSIARACAAVKCKSKFKLNETDLSVVYEVAKAESDGLFFGELCDLMQERDKTVVFRSIQRMRDAGVLAASMKYNPENKREGNCYTLGPNAASQINFWADIFDSSINL